MAIPLMLVLDYFVLQVIGVNFLNVSLTIVKASFFINVLLMTYAILYRMKDIKEETAARKTEMEIFLNKEKNDGARQYYKNNRRNVFRKSNHAVRS